MSKRSHDFAPYDQVLPSPVVDNHTHLDAIAEVLHDGVADPGIEGHLDRAEAVGVSAVVQVGCDLDAARFSTQLAGRDQRVVAAVAIHPNEAVLHAGISEIAADGLEQEPLPRHSIGLAEAIGEIARLAREDRVRAIGETGLDYFRAGPEGRAAQQRSFREHIALAKELDLPLQIHDRDAHRDVLDILAQDGAPARTVFHCFSGDREMAAECIERGYYLSFSGTITFKNAVDVREAAINTPAENILVETDAPYLTPHPWRGRPNAPYLVAATITALAEYRGVDLAQLCQVVTATSNELYGPW